MILYFLLIFSIYYVFIFLLLAGWEEVKNQKLHQSPPNANFISVVIAVRNEGENINKLLSCLEAQVFPKNRFEVMIVDDDSTDDSVAKVENFREKSRLDLKLLSMKYGSEKMQAPKKAALLKGIENSKGDIILTTDGDTWSGPHWIEAMIAPFENKKVHFVSGTVVLEGNQTFFARMQSLEFASLIGTGAALIGLGYPLMCNGANLAFRKSAFLDAEGYTGNLQDASGDDVYLMQKMHIANQGSVVFCNSAAASVRTSPQLSWKDFVDQRRRWASKWNRYLLRFSWFLPVFLFVHYASFLGAIIAATMVSEAWLPISALLTIKIVLDTIFLKKVMEFSKLRFNLVIVLFSELIYPFYALLIGTIVHFGSYSWRGRSYKHKQ